MSIEMGHIQCVYFEAMNQYGALKTSVIWVRAFIDTHNYHRRILICLAEVKR